MKFEYKLFFWLAIFFFGAAVIYGIFAGERDPAGTVALGLSGGLSIIVASFLWFSGRRLQQVRPEDNIDAEVADGAGDIGFFSPGSYWPFTLAAASAVLAIATAFLIVWMMVIATGFLLMAICGLLFEYHRSPTAH
jgi:hypothetical protein